MQYAYKLSEELLQRAFPEQETEPEESLPEKSDVTALVDLFLTDKFGIGWMVMVPGEATC